MADTIRLNANKTKIVAHRGLSGIETENTASAFVAAGNRSYFGIETDVRLTQDGALILLHDDNLKRTGGQNMPAEKYTLQEIREVPLLERGTNTPRFDLRVPILDEYVAICKKYQKVCVLELKSDFNEAQIQEILCVIRRFDYLDHVIFISFLPNPLLILRRLLPDQPIQFLSSDISDRVLQFAKENRMDLDINYRAIDQKWVEKIHQNGLILNVWTVDDPKVAEQLMAWGVDQITTNILE